MSRRRRLTFTTRLDPDHSPAPDMVNRQFVADGPNQPSLAGMTCIPTWQGLIYLKTVVDVWSGRVVGWSIGEHMHAEPVFSALDMALGSREPKNLIHHGDQRSQYVTLAFGKRCWEMGVPPPPRWTRLATPTTRRWPGDSLPVRSAKRSTAEPYGPRPKRVWQSSLGSKTGTTHAGDIRRRATFRP